MLMAELGKRRPSLEDSEIMGSGPPQVLLQTEQHQPEQKQRGCIGADSSRA